MARSLLESECGRAGDAFAGDGRAPELLDMSDNQIESLEVFSGVAVIRIRQVPAEDDVLSEIAHLTNAKGTTQNAAIRMHAHHDQQS